MAAHGEPQLEPQAEAQVPLPQEAVALPAPGLAPEGGIATGTHAGETPGTLRAMLGATSVGNRRKFVLQLQRTAGNAAVCRWLGVNRGRSVPTPATAGEDWSDVEALLAATGDGEPPDASGPRPR